MISEWRGYKEENDGQKKQQMADEQKMNRLSQGGLEVCDALIKVNKGQLQRQWWLRNVVVLDISKWIENSSKSMVTLVCLPPPSLWAGTVTVTPAYVGRCGVWRNPGTGPAAAISAQNFF